MTLRGAEPVCEERAEEGVAALDIHIVHTAISSQDPLGRRLHALRHQFEDKFVGMNKHLDWGFRVQGSERRKSGCFTCQ